MPFDWLVPALLTLLLVVVLWIALRRPPVDAGAERQARDLRDEVQRSAQGTRQELVATLGDMQRTLLAQHSDGTRTQNEQIDSFSRQLVAMQQQLADSLAQASRAQVEQGERVRASLDLRMNEVRATVQTRLDAIQADNEKKLEQIRVTVDEKLHATLEQRLGESFRQVAERLEQVHRGIGEMQKLASDVGSLSRVLSNVKTRGTFGEVQLGALLEQVFAPAQYAKNVETVPGSNQRVDFRVKTTSGWSRRTSVPMPLPSRSRRAPSRCAFGPRRRRSATSTSRRRTPPTSRSCSCPPKGSTQKR